MLKIKGLAQRCVFTMIFQRNGAGAKQATEKINSLEKESLQGLNRPLKKALFASLVSGHEFTRAASCLKSTGLQPLQTLFLWRTDFFSDL
jgi:hypothetical protein